MEYDDKLTQEQTNKFRPRCSFILAIQSEQLFVGVDVTGERSITNRHIKPSAVSILS